MGRLFLACFGLQPPLQAPVHGQEPSGHRLVHLPTATYNAAWQNQRAAHAEHDDALQQPKVATPSSTKYAADPSRRSPTELTNPRMTSRSLSATSCSMRSKLPDHLAVAAAEQCIRPSSMGAVEESCMPEDSYISWPGQLFKSPGRPTAVAGSAHALKPPPALRKLRVDRQEEMQHRASCLPTSSDINHCCFAEAQIRFTESAGYQSDEEAVEGLLGSGYEGSFTELAVSRPFSMDGGETDAQPSWVMHA